MRNLIAETFTYNFIGVNINSNCYKICRNKLHSRSTADDIFYHSIQSNKKMTYYKNDSSFEKAISKIQNKLNNL